MKIDQYDKLISGTDWLAERNLPVALALTELLQPVGGPESIVFPPTYARKGGDHPYPISVFRTDLSAQDAASKGLDANICDLDSVGSQANRMEPAFASPPLSSLVPQYAIKTADAKVNVLSMGHRIADGAVRFSALADTVRKAIEAFRDTQDVEAIAKLSPTSLLFGFWDSRGSMVRHPRLLGSSIRASNVAVLKRSAQYSPAFDPNKLGLAELQQSEPQQEAEVADKEGKKDPLSQEGFRAAPSVDSHGGVRVFGKIVRQTEINLVELRALAILRNGQIDQEASLKLKRYLLGLALVAARVQSAYSLRQGCALVMKSGAKPLGQLVYPNGKQDAFDWDFSESVAYAEAGAKSFGAHAAKPKVQEFDFKPAVLKEALNAKASEGASKKAAKKGSK